MLFSISPRSTSWQETEKNASEPDGSAITHGYFGFLKHTGAAGKAMTVQLHPANINQAIRGSKEKQKRPPVRNANRRPHQDISDKRVTAPALLPSAVTIAQVEVFEHKPLMTTWQCRIAIAARSLATDGFWSRFTSDHLIKSAAVCTGEERQRPAAWHDYAPKTPFDLSSLGLRANEFPTDRRAAE